VVVAYAAVAAPPHQIPFDDRLMFAAPPPARERVREAQRVRRLPPKIANAALPKDVYASAARRFALMPLWRAAEATTTSTNITRYITRYMPARHANAAQFSPCRRCLRCALKMSMFAMSRYAKMRGADFRCRVDVDRACAPAPAQRASAMRSLCSCSRRRTPSRRYVMLTALNPLPFCAAASPTRHVLCFCFEGVCADATMPAPRRPPSPPFDADERHVQLPPQSGRGSGKSCLMLLLRCAVRPRGKTANRLETVAELRAAPQRCRFARTPCALLRGAPYRCRSAADMPPAMSSPTPPASRLSLMLKRRAASCSRERCFVGAMRAASAVKQAPLLLQCAVRRQRLRRSGCAGDRAACRNASLRMNATRSTLSGVDARDLLAR